MITFFRWVVNLEKLCYIIPMDKAMLKIENPITVVDALKMHPMTLAFIGDGVQSLYTRTAVALGSSSKTGVLHKEVIKVVKAVSQAAVVDKIAESFDETESDIFRRARNCHVQTSAKHAEMSEYRKASGFEAILGFHYLTGNAERLEELLAIAFKEFL